MVHHCGDMYKGLENTSLTVAPGGKIYLEIYNQADEWAFYQDGRFGTSRFWWHIKRTFVSLPKVLQKTIEWLVILGICIIHLLTLKNPWKEFKSLDLRGMTWRTALVDWLIGFPYEYARPEEIVDFMVKRDFKLIKIETNNVLRTNQYCFQKNI